jgi:hypothetical protein
MEVEPGPVPGRFKSLVQLRAWASRRFPRATLVTEGLDLKAWNRIAPILDGLASDWPGVAYKLGWITTRHPFWDDNSQGAIAAADSLFGEKIAFNPFYFGSAARIRKALAKGDRAGWHPKDAASVGDRYFVSHEWGHLVFAWLRRNDYERWQGLVEIFAAEPGNPQSAFDLDKASSISRYARKGTADAFAEAFSVIQWQDKGLWPGVVLQFAQSLRGSS